VPPFRDAWPGRLQCPEAGVRKMLSFGHLPLRAGGSIQRLILHISGGFSYV